jgi:hypothetical protein
MVNACHNACTGDRSLTQEAAGALTLLHYSAVRVAVLAASERAAPSFTIVSATAKPAKEDAIRRGRRTT